MPKQSSPNEQNVSDGVKKEYVSILRSRGFDTKDIEDHGEYLLVEGDIMFDKSDLDDHLPQIEQGKINHATDNTLTRNAVSNITVYIDPSLPTTGTDDWSSAILDAMVEWTNISGSVITMTQSSSSANIVVKSDLNELGDNIIAVAEFPANENSPGYQIRINLDFSNNKDISYAQKKYNMVHELGHCIGFRHTNWSGLGEKDANEIGHGIPSSDPNSVMNGKTADNSWNGFSYYDKLAAEFIYPDWANYLQLGNPVWAGTEAMTSLNNDIYAVENSRLYKINPNDGSYTQLGGAVWTGTEAMTSLNSYIYLVENSRLYKVDPTNGSYTQLGGAVWAGTEAMTSLNGYIYLVENSRLYKVDPTNGSYTQLGGAVWAGTEAMTSLNGYIYLVENSRLYKVDPTNGTYTQLGVQFGKVLLQ